MTKDLYPMPVALPARYKPLHGAKARQLATWLERYANRKPVCPLSKRATKMLRDWRRGKLPLGVGRVNRLLAYINRHKILRTPSPTTLTLGQGIPLVNWGDPTAQMGEAERGAGHPLPLVSPKKFRD